MLIHLTAIAALGVLCAAWVVLQRVSGCPYGSSCAACTCREPPEVSPADGARNEADDDRGAPVVALRGSATRNLETPPSSPGTVPVGTGKADEVG